MTDLEWIKIQADKWGIWWNRNKDGGLGYPSQSIDANHAKAETKRGRKKGSVSVIASETRSKKLPEVREFKCVESEHFDKLARFMLEEKEFQMIEQRFKKGRSYEYIALKARIFYQATIKDADGVEGKSWQPNKRQAKRDIERALLNIYGAYKLARGTA